jgi:hypothetical protein
VRERRHIDQARRAGVRAARRRRGAFRSWRGRSRRRTGLATEIREAAARLGDNDVDRRRIIAGQLPARRRCPPRLCHQHVGPEVRGSGPPAGVHEPEEGVSGRRRANLATRVREEASPISATPEPGNTAEEGSTSECAGAGDAHHRRLSAGADTTPTTASSPSMSAISVALTGTPRTSSWCRRSDRSPWRRGSGRTELLAGDRIEAAPWRARPASAPPPTGRRRSRGQVRLRLDDEVAGAEALHGGRVRAVRGHAQIAGRRRNRP